MLRGLADSRWGLAEYGLSGREAILADFSVSHHVSEDSCCMLAQLGTIKLYRSRHTFRNGV